VEPAHYLTAFITLAAVLAQDQPTRTVQPTVRAVLVVVEMVA